VSKVVERAQHAVCANRHSDCVVRGWLEHAHSVDVRVGAKAALFRQWIAGGETFGVRLVDAELQAALVCFDPTSKRLQRASVDPRVIADGRLRQKQELARTDVLGDGGSFVEVW
jgi:hypothetical protein